MRILSLVIPFIFGHSVRCTFYKSAARSICTMADAEKYSIAFVTINDKEAAAKLSEYEIMCLVFRDCGVGGGGELGSHGPPTFCHRQRFLCCY